MSMKPEHWPDRLDVWEVPVNNNYLAVHPDEHDIGHLIRQYLSELELDDVRVYPDPSAFVHARWDEDRQCYHRPRFDRPDGVAIYYERNYSPDELIYLERD